MMHNYLLLFRITIFCITIFHITIFCITISNMLWCSIILFVFILLILQYCNNQIILKYTHYLPYIFLLWKTQYLIYEQFMFNICIFFITICLFTNKVTLNILWLFLSLHIWYTCIHSIVLILLFCLNILFIFIDLRYWCVLRDIP